MKEIKKTILGLRRWQKTTVLIVLDAISIGAALYFAYYMRIGPLSAALVFEILPLMVLVIGVALIAFWSLGSYGNLLRAISIRILNPIGLGILFSAVIILAYASLNPSLLVPRSLPAIFAIVAIALIGSSRIAGRWMYRYLVGLNKKSQPIVIYGAGETGTHVAAVLDNSREFSMIGFIDDDKSLQGSRIRGRKIYPVEYLGGLCAANATLRVLICISSVKHEQRRRIIEKLQEFPVQVLTVPPLPEVIAGRASIENIQEVKIEDLLGREPVPPIDNLFQHAIQNQVVLVTGGGGSIGQELCSQIAQNDPSCLLVIENSEIALYRTRQRLTRELGEKAEKVEIEYILSSVTDPAAMRSVFESYKPNTVYHAAAYKHVSIVEKNVIQALKNNIVGTHVVASASAQHGVDRFILVSTDKAVRPTSVMGATKRVAELVVQGFQKSGSSTIFAMVRFGNVLGSSGSVIPLFQKQIKEGGPITVTHPNVTRYFMTVREAAQLVVQAGYIATGGEVFVLDMGEPVPIEKLARLMVQLSGQTTKSDATPDGNIAIHYTGLRPGEKLYEELIISANATGTEHPKIMKAQEKSISYSNLEKEIEGITRIIESNDEASAIKVLDRLVEGFSADSRITQSNGNFNRTA